ncbi:TetR family transcriptional regulator [Actinorhabdospora filicis]|uniref:TetR family transcriptional regulator n=1 Tax=Actinorhabdospora filicis TaxID=1785913 RepID=A0A9W6SRZ4_9ACTN|nr:TetR/AcrR family transcriptional regulator [Actinorhabdospora filicis]GLZ81316.1 TetR family transcriptional regulator [Actinorhabdospora filicis]
MPRSDASRNREAVLASARALFSAVGPDVQMPEIAKAAGVGVGTVYRHFPSRDALIDAAADARFAEIEEYARAYHLGPGDGLIRYLFHVGAILAEDRGLSRAIESRHGTTEPKGPAREALEKVVRAMLEIAQETGEIRLDTPLSDIDLVLAGLSAVIRWGGDWQRYLAIAVRGLRPPAPDAYEAEEEL